MSTPDVLVLFSGGLDSLLAATLLQRQGLAVRCLHFYSPFFGKPAKRAHWQEIYHLEIEAIDASVPFTKALLNPSHGTGKNLNPCIDCKIVLLNLARELLPQTGARFLATGEVLGQRPMSQRTESLNIIKKASNSADILLRPLSARLLPPTPMEESGFVNREKLLAISGRGRNEQLALARTMGITEVPAPGGGCRLTERENSRRYWALLNRYKEEDSGNLEALIADFWLANIGRMLMHRESGNWVAIGRNRADNEKIRNRLQPADLLLALPFPGPVLLARNGRSWPDALLASAASLLASYSPEAVATGSSLKVLAGRRHFLVSPARQAEVWGLPEFEEVRSAVRKMEQLRQGGSSSKK